MSMILLVDVVQQTSGIVIFAFTAVLIGLINCAYLYHQNKLSLVNISVVFSTLTAMLCSVGPVLVEGTAKLSDISLALGFGILAIVLSINNKKD